MAILHVLKDARFISFMICVYFPQLQHRLGRHDPHIIVGVRFAHVLYGPKALFLDGEDSAKSPES